MPAGRGEEERFAAGVEYGSMPASSGAGDDEDLARELELVALLRSAGPALSPTPAARSRAKERLMAAFEAQHATSDDTGPVAVIAPVAVVERPESRPAPARRSRHAMPETEAAEQTDDAAELAEVRPLRRTRRERPGHRRAALLGAAAAAALVALAGTGTFASQDALPGDPLYDVKRVAESTGYALTFGEQAKARRHLEQAQRRLDEVEGMVTRDQAARASGAPADAADQELVRSTMQEFDSNANEGSRLLLADAADPAQVDDVREWATEQSARLSGLRSTMPAQDKADESLALLDRLLDEASAASQAACDPAAGPCPTVLDGDPLDGADVTGSVVPEDVVPGTPEPRTTARGGADDQSGDAGDDTPADDEQPSGSSDGGSSDDDESDRSGGSGGGDAAGSGGSGGSGDVSVPLPLPAPVRAPSVVPGLPGVSLGG